MPFDSTSRSMALVGNYTALASDLAATCGEDAAIRLSSGQYLKSCFKLSPLSVNRPGYEMNLDVCTANFDTLLSVFSCRTTVAGLPYNCKCASNDDSVQVCGPNTAQSAVSNVTYEIGAEYYVVVTNYAKG